jgi:cytochrome c-type biogenesis protein
VGEFIAAFVAGVASFISPCVLPLIPVYLSLVSGVSMQELQAGETGNWRRVVGSSLLFIIGFSIVFTLLGASASHLGAVLGQYRSILTRAGGVLVILMGLLFMGAVRIPFLQQERRFHMARKPAGLLGPVLMGMAFAFGWTPCIGGFASTILVYAMDSKTVVRGAALLLTYSIGLGLPLMATSLAFTRALTAFKWIKKNYTPVTIASGLLLILLGSLLLTNKMTVIQMLIQRLSF